MDALPSEPDLLMLLHDVARLLRLETDRRARLHGMNRAQWVMLIKLARHPGLSQKELAELLEVEPMSVARLTDRLAARDLVERRADPRDRRIWRIHLTDAAKPLLDEIETQRGAMLAAVRQALPEGMQGAMIDGLLRIKAELLPPGRCCSAAMMDDERAGRVGRKDKPAEAEQEMV